MGFQFISRAEDGTTLQQIESIDIFSIVTDARYQFQDIGVEDFDDSEEHFYFVEDGGEYIHIVNISDRSSPFIESSIHETDSDFSSCTLVDNYLYTFDIGEPENLRVYDVSDVNNPTFTTSLDTRAQRSILREPTGQYLYLGGVAARDNEVIDVTDPANPVSVREISFNFTRDVFEFEGDIGILATPGGDTYMDISDLTSPVALITVDPSSTKIDNRIELSYSRNYLSDGYWISFGEGKFYMLDIVLS